MRLIFAANNQSIFSFLLFIIITCNFTGARKHHLEVRNDMRPFVSLSTFGYLSGGYLDVQITYLTIDDLHPDDIYGLSLVKTTIEELNPYLDEHQSRCILKEPQNEQRYGPVLFFLFDFNRDLAHVTCSAEWQNMHIYKDLMGAYRQKRQSQTKLSNTALFMQRRRRRNADLEAEPDNDWANLNNESDLNNNESSPNVTIEPVKSHAIFNKQAHGSEESDMKSEKYSQQALPSPPKQRQRTSKQKLDSKPTLKSNSFTSVHQEANVLHKLENGQYCNDFTLPLYMQIIDGVLYYNFTFSMFVGSLPDEGLYNLFFHACPNYRIPKIISFNADIEENNNGNYLSAGEMPLPALYCMMSLLFFLSGLFWMFILKKSRHPVFKIHYLMGILVFLKSLSLMFHSINYHFIEKRGEHVEAWAILYYIAHVLKGAVLFITILLIGTGWTFIKHILSDKDKKIFMIVIPLQVFANVAEIVIDESDQSDADYRTWHNLLFFVDFLCCIAIIFPVVWSIRHLQAASATDGKAAMNLRKLRLFREFYIIILCYIYFTRFIVHFIQMTVVFKYMWLDAMFKEIFTYILFILTGYKFRPTTAHPYFTLPSDDDDQGGDEVEVLTTTGLTEGVHRTKTHSRNQTQPTTVVVVNNDEENQNLIANRESSHEYD